jgi:hypothetical protein
VKVSQSNTLDALRRVQGFLDAQATALGPIIPASLRARLDGAVTSLAGFQTEQNTADSTAHGEAVNQTALRKTFVTKFMEPIAHIATGALKTSGDFPTLTIASSRLRKSDFLGAAQSLADAAAKNETVLTTDGMPTDFLTQLQAAIAAMTTSKAAQDRAVSRRGAATQGIADTDITAKQILGVLNGVIEPALAKNTSLLADWKSSKRISPAPTPLPSQPTGIPAAGSSTPAPVVAADPVVPPAAETAAPTAPTTTAAAVPTDPQATKPAA